MLFYNSTKNDLDNETQFITNSFFEEEHYYLKEDDMIRIYVTKSENTNDLKLQNIYGTLNMSHLNSSSIYALYQYSCEYSVFALRNSKNMWARNMTIRNVIVSLKDVAPSLITRI